MYEKAASMPLAASDWNRAKPETTSPFGPGWTVSGKSWAVSGSPEYPYIFHVCPASASFPNTEGVLKAGTPCAELSMYPSEVPATAKARFGKVWVGTEANHPSHTANPFASPDSTGRVSAAYMPMIEAGTAPTSLGSSGCAGCWSSFAKLVTNPPFAASPEAGGVSELKSWSLVALYPSDGLARSEERRVGKERTSQCTPY